MPETHAYAVDELDFDEFDFDFDLEDEDLLVEDVAAPTRAQLAAVGLEERTRIIEGYVRAELARVLRVPPETIDTVGRPMNSLGVGSIHGLEMQRRMEAVLEVEVNLQRLLRANSAAELIDCLAGQLGPEDSPHKTPAARSHEGFGAVGRS